MINICKYKYESVADSLREKIKNGDYSTGKIPDEKRLIKQFKVGKITIYNALKLLMEEGIISRVQGKGTFINGVFGKSLTISGQVAVVMSHIGHYYSSLAKQIRSTLYEKSLYSIPVDYLSEKSFIKGKERGLINRLSLLLNSNIHGVIYDGNAYHKFPFMDKYTNMRSVAVNYFDAPGDIPGSAVLIDFEKGIKKVVKYLKGKDKKKILFLSHRPSEFPIKDPLHATRHPINQLEGGYLDSMKECGLNNSKEILIKTTNNFDDLIRGILSRTDRPEAIICSSDIDALKIIMIAFTIGIKIPEELSVIGMYNTPWAEESPIKITSLSFKEDKIATEAVNLIVADNWEKKIIKIDPKLIIRQSA